MWLQLFTNSINPTILFAPISFGQERFLLSEHKIIEYEPRDSIGLRAGVLTALKDESARRNACYTLLGHGKLLLEIMTHSFFAADVGRQLPASYHKAKVKLAHLLGTPDCLDTPPPEKEVIELLEHIQWMMYAVRQASFSANEATARALQAKKAAHAIIFRIYGLAQLDEVVHDHVAAFTLHEEVYQAVAGAVSKGIHRSAVQDLLVRGPVAWAELWIEASVQAVDEFDQKAAFGRTVLFKGKPGYPATHGDVRDTALLCLRRGYQQHLDRIAAIENPMERFRARIALTPESLLGGLWRDLPDASSPGWTMPSTPCSSPCTTPRASSVSLIDRSKVFLRRVSGGSTDTLKRVPTDSTVMSRASEETLVPSPPPSRPTPPNLTAAPSTIDFAKPLAVKWMHHARVEDRARAYSAWRARAVQQPGADVPAGYLPTTAELTLAGYSPSAIDLLHSTGELPREDRSPEQWERAYEIAKDLRPRKDSEYHVQRPVHPSAPQRGGAGVEDIDVHHTLNRVNGKLRSVQRQQERAEDGEYGTAAEDSSDDDRPPSPTEWERHGKAEAMAAVKRIRERLGSRRWESDPRVPYQKPRLNETPTPPPSRASIAEPHNLPEAIVSPRPNGSATKTISAISVTTPRHRPAPFHLHTTLETTSGSSHVSIGTDGEGGTPSGLASRGAMTSLASWRDVEEGEMEAGDCDDEGEQGYNPMGDLLRSEPWLNLPPDTDVRDGLVYMHQRLTERAEERHRVRREGRRPMDGTGAGRSLGVGAGETSTLDLSSDTADEFFECEEGDDSVWFT